MPAMLTAISAALLLPVLGSTIGLEVLVVSLILRDAVKSIRVNRTRLDEIHYTDLIDLLKKLESAETKTNEKK